MLSHARWGRLPLTQRLTLFFTVVAAAVVLGLGYDVRDYPVRPGTVVGYYCHLAGSGG